MIFIADIPGERLDAFLARTVEGMTRSAAQRLLEDGCVLKRQTRQEKRQTEYCR